MESKDYLATSRTEPAPSHDGVARHLPDNCVEYLLFDTSLQIAARKQLSQIETIRESAMQLASCLTKDYIWQKDEFNLELRNEQGLVYLRGVTNYGDAVEDEWLIVYILREMTKMHTNLWVRVFDTDGEFLLIEAANVLPKWLSPEIDHNRVWINDGKLFIIPIKDEPGLKSQNLSLPEAVKAFTKCDRDAFVHSSLIETEAFYRLEKYPTQIADSIHHSLMEIPRKVAYVLHSLPKSVAPAVEMFYLRDSANLKRVVSGPGSLVFPPEDLVKISVKLSKVLFAQLRSQRFDPPQAWRAVLQRAQAEASSADVEKVLGRLDMGMKLTCGFEMLAANVEKSSNRVVRELAIVLEDLIEDGDEALPSNNHINSWKDAKREDDETWMDINYDDFERELEGRRNKGSQDTATGFGDAKTQTDLRKIVSRFEAFLNDEDAGVDGVEFDDMDVDNDDDDSEEDGEFEDEEVCFNEEEFARMMREMIGLPAEDSERSSKRPTKSRDIGEEEEGEENKDDEEIKQLASMFEAELDQHGVLKLDSASDKKLRLSDETKGTSNPRRATAELINAEEENSEEEVDIDFNLAKNLLESFKSQAGMAGPTGNLLGMMGIQLPRDEDEGADDGENSEHSKQGQLHL